MRYLYSILRLRTVKTWSMDVQPVMRNAIVLPVSSEGKVSPNCTCVPM